MLLDKLLDVETVLDTQDVVMHDHSQQLEAGCMKLPISMGIYLLCLWWIHE